MLPSDTAMARFCRQRADFDGIGLENTTGSLDSISPTQFRPEIKPLEVTAHHLMHSSQLPVTRAAVLLLQSARTETTAIRIDRSVQAVHTSQVGLVEEVNSLDAALQRSAEKDSGYYGRSGLAASAATKFVVPGGVKDICFLDADTGFWQLAGHQLIQSGASSTDSIPHIGMTHQCCPRGAPCKALELKS